MKMRVAPRYGVSRARRRSCGPAVAAAAAAVSRLLTTVVPTAITRPPAARAALIAAQVASGTSRYSSCICMRVDVIHPHRLKGAGADVQGDERMPHLALLERGENIGIEMQSRGRAPRRRPAPRAYTVW